MRKMLFVMTAIMFGAVTIQAQVRRPNLVPGNNSYRHYGPRLATTAVLDPQLFICDGSVTCTSALGGDPNFVTLSGGTISAQVAFNNGNGHVMTSDVIIILGVPDGGAVPSITGASLLGTATFNASSSGSAFDQFANLGSSGGSESFTNWTTSPFPGGATNPDSGVTSFTLYEFDLGSSLTTGVPQGFTITNGSSGTFIIAYGCDGALDSCSGGDVFQTVFTNTGFSGSGPPTVPEPGTLALLGTGLLGLAKAVRNKGKKQVNR